MASLPEILEKLPENICLANAAGLKAVIQFDVKGLADGLWFVVIRDGEVSVAPGEFFHPQLRISATEEVFVGIWTGRVDGKDAFLAGRLELIGDLRLALRSLSIFRQRR